jgi:hypothetical protein
MIKVPDSCLTLEAACCRINNLPDLKINMRIGLSLRFGNRRCDSEGGHDGHEDGCELHDEKDFLGGNIVRSVWLIVTLDLDTGKRSEHPAVLPPLCIQFYHCQVGDHCAVDVEKITRLFPTV